MLTILHIEQAKKHDSSFAPRDAGPLVAASLTGAPGEEKMRLQYARRINSLYFLVKQRVLIHERLMAYRASC